MSGRGARRGTRFPAVAAEPAGPGIGRARDPLAREVRLLGALLGQVIAEQAGPELFGLVEGLRSRLIAIRRGALAADEDARERAQERIAADVAALDRDQLEALTRSFTLYFQLVNLAEERHRVRILRRAARRAPDGVLDGSVADAFERLRGSASPADASEGIEDRLARLVVSPVLTAHPTEARRRTLLVALRRIGRLLGRLADPDVAPDEDIEIRRRLREEIATLWRTAEIRSIAPAPLDEVRAGLAFFDGRCSRSCPWSTGRSTPPWTSRRRGWPSVRHGHRARDRYRPDRHATARRRGVPPVRIVDRR